MHCGSRNVDVLSCEGVGGYLFSNKIHSVKTSARYVIFEINQNNCGSVELILLNVVFELSQNNCNSRVISPSILSSHTLSLIASFISSNMQVWVRKKQS